MSQCQEIEALNVHDYNLCYIYHRDKYDQWLSCNYPCSTAMFIL